MHVSPSLFEKGTSERPKVKKSAGIRVGTTYYMYSYELEILVSSVP